jgi:hypothetical protein
MQPTTITAAVLRPRTTRCERTGIHRALDLRRQGEPLCTCEGER